MLQKKSRKDSLHKDSLRVKLLVTTKSKSERERGESFCGVAAAAKGIKIVACRRTTGERRREGLSVDCA